MTRADKIMEQMGFPDDADGPFVRELREAIAYDAAYNGLVSSSAGAWIGGDSPSYDERAKAFLSMRWARNNGASYRVECLDPAISWRTNLKTGRRKLEIEWRYIPAALGDQFRKAAYKLRKLRMPENPYQ